MMSLSVITTTIFISSISTPSNYHGCIKILLFWCLKSWNKLGCNLSHPQIFVKLAWYNSKVPASSQRFLIANLLSIFTKFHTNHSLIAEGRGGFMPFLKAFVWSRHKILQPGFGLISLPTSIRTSHISI